MTDDIKLAFAHPSERSLAMANADVRDRISLRDHTREVEIGAFQSERGLTQRVRFDVVVEVGLPELAQAVQSDDVDKILSYDAITDAIDRGLAAERLNLLETLAARIAEDILSSPLAARVFIRIEKLDRGPGELGVEIVRDRSTATELNVAKTERPLVVYLDNSTILHENLVDILGKLEEAKLPLILCVGLLGEKSSLNAPAAQKRIDLLSIEQNAWRLASLDARCAVVATRTELDWAMKNRQICVWAPSKLVLDATGDDFGDTVEPHKLVDWFAAEFDAQKIMYIGPDDKPFAGSDESDTISVINFLSSV